MSSVRGGTPPPLAAVETATRPSIAPGTVIVIPDRETVAERPAQLGLHAGRVYSRLAQPLRGCRQQVAVPVDELDLDLPPGRRFRRSGGALVEQHPGAHRIVGKYGQHPSVGAFQVPLDPVGADVGDRDELCTASGSEHQPADRDRWATRPASRSPQLEPGVAAARCRNLEVPALVAAAEAPAQRYPRSQQPQVGGVVVGGGQVVAAVGGDGGDAVHLQVGYLGRGGCLEGLLDLEMGGGVRSHPPIVPDGRRSQLARPREMRGSGGVGPDWVP